MNETSTGEAGVSDAPLLVADANRCPGCAAELHGAAVCPECGLALRGPAAATLWAVTREMARLDGHRIALLAALGAQSPGATSGAATGAETAAPQQAQPYYAPMSPAPWAAPAWTPPPRREWTPRRVQNLLLSLGALLVAVAAVIFTAYAWGRLPVSIRALILLAVTVAVAGLGAVAHQRRLSSTAEALSLLAVALALVDAYAARRANVIGLGRTDASSYWAIATLVIAALTGGYAALVRVRAPRYAALLLAQLPLVIIATRPKTHGTALRALPVLAQGFALIAVGRAFASRDRWRDLSVWAIVSGAGTCGITFLLLAVAALQTSSSRHETRLAVGVLAIAALLSGLVAVLWRADRSVCAGLLGGAALSFAVAAGGASRLGLVAVQRPAAVAATGLLLLLAAAALPALVRMPALLVAGATLATSVALVAEHAVTGVAGPLSWLAHPWLLRTANGSARDTLVDGERWEGTVVVPVVLVVVAVAAVAAGELIRRRAALLPVSTVLAAAAVVLVPLGLAWTFRSALVWDCAVGVGLLGAGAEAQRRRLAGLSMGLLSAATAVLAIALAWSLAHEPATLVVFAVTAVASAVLALFDGAARPVAAGTAAALVVAWSAAFARAQDLAVDRTGFVVAACGCACVLTGWAIRRRAPDVHAIQLVGVAAFGVGTALSASDARVLSWTLLIGATTAYVEALRADRRWAAWAGTALLTGFLWDRLAIAHVTAPEAYSVPPAMLLLAAGWWHRRAGGLTSWVAFGPGLAVGLLPSLVAALPDPGLARPLVLGVVALGILLSGVSARLQAPLVLGAGTLAVDAIVQLGRIASLFPRWVAIGTVGALLLGMGATYEQRRRDLRRMRDAVAAYG